MEELIKLLDKNLEYLTHEIEKDVIKIYVKSKLESAQCPYCGIESSKVHSRKKRKFQDLPIQGKKVLIIMDRRKFFCINSDCSHKTFAETLDFIAIKGRKTNRLQDEILRVSLTQSSVSASKFLKRSVADVCKSTICTLLKKNK